MDSTFNKLVENLSFQVMAGPCNHNVFDDIAPKSVGTPVNVKVKFRPKDDVHRGVISVPKFENVRMSQNLRLINSDETIMSFDFLMDTKASGKLEKKSQRKVFQIFRPGICLGSKNKDDDDRYPYVPPIIEKENTTFSATKLSVINHEQSYNLKKNTIRVPFDDANRAPTMFLGKCKPGGCLDPPFGEERYIYKPILDKNDSVKYQIKGEVENSQGPMCQSYNPQLYISPISSSPLKEKEKIQECKLYDEFLITYPSSLNCNEVSNNKEILRAINIQKSSISNSEKRIESFYKPPRSKEASISSNMEGYDTQKVIDDEIKPNYTIATNLKSYSKDSIYKQTGCPAEPILPVVVNLSPIESDSRSLRNNPECDKEQIRSTRLSGQNIYKFDNETEVKQQSQEVLENLSENSNVLLQLNNFIEKKSVTPDNLQRLSDDIKMPPERFPNNKTNLFNEGQITTEHRDEQRIIVIAPARDFDETLTSEMEDCEYSTNFIDYNQNDLSIEFRENYSDTQCADQKNYIVNEFESQVYQTNLENQSFNDVSNNETNVQKNQTFDYLFSDPKSKIKEDDTSPKIILSKQSNINNILLIPAQSSRPSTKNSKSNLEDLKNKYINISEKGSNLNNSLKLTDSTQNSKHERTLPYKDGEKSSIEDEETKEIVPSFENIQKSFNSKQKAIEDTSLKSSRHMLVPVVLENKSDERLNSTIHTSEVLTVSPDVVVNSSHVAHQELRKPFNNDLQNNENITLKSTTQDISSLKYLEETNTMRSNILNFSNSPTKSSKEETTSHPELTSLHEKSVEKTEMLNQQHFSNIDVDHIVTDMKLSKNFNISIDRSKVQSNDNFPISSHIMSKSFEKPIVGDSLSQSDNDEFGKGLSQKISLEIVETPETFETELDKVVHSKISEHNAQTNKKVDNNETFIKHMLSKTILQDHTDKEYKIRETSKHSLKTNINLNSKESNVQNDKIEIEMKNDEFKLISIKEEELKPLNHSFGSKDQFKVPSNKEVSKSDVLLLDFALQAYFNNNKERAFKTIDSDRASECRQESILRFKSKLRVNKDEIRVPIDTNTDFVILVKRNTIINTEDKTRQDKNQYQDALEKGQGNLYAELPNELQQMTMIYEQTLKPVQSILKTLKKEVDSLVHNQIRLREMLTNKSKPARLVKANRKCACYRM